MIGATDRLSRLREPAIAVGGVVVAFVVAYLIPGSQGARHTPTAILFSGLVQGMLAGLTAAGLVLVYRATRIINFAQLALGVFGAVATFNVVYMLPGIPFPVSVLIGLVGGALTGVIFQLSFGRRFARAPRLVLTLATVFAATWLTQFGSGIASSLPGLPDANQRSADVLNGTQDLHPLLPFATFHFQVGALPLPFGFAELFALGLSLALLVGLGVFLQRTRLGKAIRAMAENTERASLLGISVAWMGLLVWAIAGMLSAANVMLAGFTSNAPGAYYSPGPELLLGSIAAAVLARMRSLFTAVMVAIAYSVLSATLQFQQGTLQPILDLVLVVALSVGLVVGGNRLSRGAEATAWEATREVRPIPREMAALPLVRVARISAVLAGLAVLVAYPVFVGAADLSLGAVLMLFGIVILSLVILSGWAGQASGGQFALVAIGAITAALLNTKLGVSFYVVVPVAVVVTAAVGALLAFPALRIQGLFLLASTYAFAVMIRSFILNPEIFPSIQSGPITRPTLFLIDFDNERSMYYLCVGALVLAAVVVVNLRRSRFGRLLIGVRDNESNVRSAGVSPVRIRITAFAISGALAGFAGALFVFQQRALIPTSFEVGQSLTMLQTVIVGGAASIGGGLTGLFLLNGLNRVLGSLPGAAPALAVMPLLILYVSPGGLIAMLQRLRDAVLRIIAERRQLIVPSLFADIDPEALHLRLIPLAAPLPTGGLHMVRDRFDLAPSRLWGRRQVGQNGTVAGREDASAIAAAAKAQEPELHGAGA